MQLMRLCNYNFKTLMCFCSKQVRVVYVYMLTKTWFCIFHKWIGFTMILQCRYTAKGWLKLPKEYYINNG